MYQLHAYHLLYSVDSRIATVLSSLPHVVVFVFMSIDIRNITFPSLFAIASRAAVSSGLPFYYLMHNKHHSDLAVHLHRCAAVYYSLHPDDDAAAAGFTDYFSFQYRCRHVTVCNVCM